MQKDKPLIVIEDDPSSSDDLSSSDDVDDNDDGDVDDDDQKIEEGKFIVWLPF